MVSDSVTKSVNQFDEKIIYNQDGLRGVLGKDGDPIPTVVSGTYTPGESMTVTDYAVDTGTNQPPATWQYSVDGYTGTINLTSTTSEIRSVDHGHYETHTESQFFSKTHDNTATSYYTSSGELIRTEYSWDNSGDHPFLHVDEDGYVGDIPRVNWELIAGPTTTYNQDGSYQTETTYRGYYEGTLTKEVTEWIPNIVEETVYTGYYSGTVSTADNDTRVWEYTQNYKGCAYSEEAALQNLAKPVNSECDGDPVNMVTGNFFSTWIDLNIPERGLALEITRYYNSRDTRTSILGKAWRFSYDSSLETDTSTGNAKVIYPDGHTIVFSPIAGTNQYSAPESIFDRLEKNADDTFTLKLQNKLIYKYSSGGKLASITDRNENTVTLQYDVSGQLNSVTGAGGRSLSFTFQDGKIKTITDPIGRTVEYTYDTGSNLKAVKSLGGGIITYDYVSGGLQSITDQNSKKYIENEYDSFGRVIRQYDENSNAIQFDYDDANLENTCTYLSTGDVTRYQYNEMLFITKKTFADNTTEEYTYDQWGNRNSVKDRNNHTTSYTFDARGNMLSETAPAPFGYTTTYTYDSSDNLKQTAASGGAITSFDYDEHSNLTKTTIKLDDTANSTTSVTYDVYGRAASITDAENKTTLIEYGVDNNPTKITDPEGNIIEYGYDDAGRKTSMTTCYGTTHYHYDANDKVVKVIDPAGNTTRIKYDAVGNMVKLINPKQYNSTTDDGAGYTFTYDAMDRMVRQTDPLGNHKGFKYDQVGRVIKEINPNYYDTAADDGAGTGFEYEANGRLARVVNPSGQKSRIQYDAVGNRIKTIDANNYDENSDSGPGFQYSYDEMNRLIEVRDTNGTVIKRLVYDANSNVVKEIDAKGYQSGSTDETRYGTLYKYNLAGWLLEKRVPLKIENNEVYYQVTKYVYDLTGKVIEQKTSPQYVTASSEPAAWNTITYTYFDNGRVKSAADSLGSQIEYTYDALGNTASEKKKINADKYSVTVYHYNSAGFLDKVWQEIDGTDLVNGISGKINAETTFEYDANGNITKVTRPEGYTTEFEYDDADRLIAKHDEVEADQIELKNTTASVEFSSSGIYPGQQYDCRINIKPDSEVTGVNMEVEYDARAFEFMGFTPEVNGILVDGGTAGKVKIRSSSISVEADSTIATIKLKVKSGIYGSSYVTFNPSATYADADSDKNSFSELLGKAVSLKGPDMNDDGKVEANDLTLAAAKCNISIGAPGYNDKYDINSDGIINSSDLDYIKDYLFDDNTLNSLSMAKYYEKSSGGVCKASTSTVIRTTAYQYDKAGNLIKKTDCNGKSIEYIYDVNNRLISVVDKVGNKSRVFYDEEGNRIKEILPQNYDIVTDDGLGTTYVYDTMNRLVEVRDAADTVIQRRVYDINGLLEKLIDAKGYQSGPDDSSRYGIEYSYDIGSRVKTITGPEAKLKGNVSESYEYDASGYILSHTDGNNNTTTYERDMWGKITKVTDAKNINTVYTYDYAGNITSVKDGNNNTTQYTYNSLNKLASVIDPSNQVVTYKYDKEGRIALEVDRNGQNISYSYNSDNNLRLKDGNQQEKYFYNKDGNMLAAMNESGVDEFLYTDDGLLQKRTRNGNLYTEYQYNKDRNITKVTDGKGASTAYTYDTLGRLEAVYDAVYGSSNLLANYSYNSDNTIDSILYNTGVNTEYVYDRDKNITGLTHKNSQGGVINSFFYTYDNNGNQLTRTENGADTTYTYDELNRLETVSYPSIGTETYTYDNAGNRLSKVLGSESTDYSYDARNRLVQSITNGITIVYDYDNNGNLVKTTKGTEITTYTYDGFNRLKETNMPDGIWMNNYYDAFGMRIAVVENSIRSDFTLDGGNVITENSNGKDVRYIRGLGLIATRENQGDYAYYLHNAHGDVVNLVNGTGDVLNSYNYDAFGNAADYTETVANRFMYAGEQFDKVTGQYYLRARYYAPQVGRFITEDSYRGELNNPQTLNLYTYCENDPINFIDPTGHYKSGDENLPDYINIAINGTNKNGKCGLSGEWFAAKTDSDRKAIEAKADLLRASAITTAYLLNNESAVPLGLIRMGHNAALLVNSANQGFYFSTATAEPYASQAQKLKVTEGQMSMKFLTPNETQTLLSKGVLYDVPIHTSNNLNKTESIQSGYSRYISINVSTDNGQKMYEEGMYYYNKPPKYSGLLNNCGHMALRILNAGGLNYITNSALPNEQFIGLAQIYDMQSIK